MYKTCLYLFRMSTIQDICWLVATSHHTEGQSSTLLDACCPLAHLLALITNLHICSAFICCQGCGAEGVSRQPRRSLHHIKKASLYQLFCGLLSEGHSTGDAHICSPLQPPSSGSTVPTVYPVRVLPQHHLLYCGWLAVLPLLHSVLAGISSIHWSSPLF